MSEADAEILMQSAVKCARDAIERHPRRVEPLVAASCGCYGAVLADGSEYTGDYGDVSTGDIAEFHASRLRVLLGNPNSMPDVVAFETIPCLDEIKAIVQALEMVYDSNSSIPVLDCWVTCCCRDEHSLSSGEPFAEAASILAKCIFVNAVGINCTPPRYCLELLKTAHRVAPSKLGVVYPNTGETFDPKTKTWSCGEEGTIPSQECIRSWRDEGHATMIGGCCRVGAKELAEICNSL